MNYCEDFSTLTLTNIYFCLRFSLGKPFRIILSDPVFNLHWTAIVDSCPYLHFLRQLHLKLDMRYFINLIRKYWHLRQEMLVWLLFMTMSKCLAKNNVKSWSQKDILTSCTRLVLHTPHKTTVLCTGQWHGNFIFQWCLWGSVKEKQDWGSGLVKEMFRML